MIIGLRICLILQLERLTASNATDYLIPSLPGYKSVVHALAVDTLSAEINDTAAIKKYVLP